MILSAFLFFSSACAASPKAPRPKEITGAEWLKISVKDRRVYIFAAMEILKGRGMNPDQSVDFYDQAVEKTLLRRPDLYSNNITSTLASLVDEELDLKKSTPPR